MNGITLQAPAKVNLFLEITGRRSDGYHLLASWMQKLDLYDEVEIIPNEQGGISLHCPGSDLPEDEDNLVYKAAELFLDSLYAKQVTPSIGVEITLRKNIPVAAGLGGGSSDAAAVLNGLNTLYGEPFSNDELCELGVRLGADIPFFIVPQGACLASGVGEILEQVEPLFRSWVVLVNPGISVSTKWVYEKFALTIGENNSNLGNSRIELCRGASGEKRSGKSFLRKILYNDLEKVTVAAYPQLANIKDELIGCGADGAMMSGSGPTVFAVFAEQATAEGCYRLMREKYGSTYITSPLD